MTAASVNQLLGDVLNVMVEWCPFLKGGNLVGRRRALLSSEALEGKQQQKKKINKRAIRNGFMRQSKASQPI